eukprot:9481170-Pyramimonas_sp.AAC.1
MRRRRRRRRRRRNRRRLQLSIAAVVACSQFGEIGGHFPRQIALLAPSAQCSDAGNYWQERMVELTSKQVPFDRRGIHRGSDAEGSEAIARGSADRGVNQRPWICMHLHARAYICTNRVCIKGVWLCSVCNGRSRWPVVLCTFVSLALCGRPGATIDAPLPVGKPPPVIEGAHGCK